MWDIDHFNESKPAFARNLRGCTQGRKLADFPEDSPSFAPFTQPCGLWFPIKMSKSERFYCAIYRNMKQPEQQNDLAGSKNKLSLKRGLHKH